MTDDIRELVRDLRIVGNFGGAPIANQAADLIASLSARLEAAEKVVEAARRLKEIVEGATGAWSYGTWRSDESHMRLKDTDEWVRFYVALAALTEQGAGSCQHAWTDIHNVNAGDGEMCFKCGAVRGTKPKSGRSSEGDGGKNDADTHTA